MARRLNFVAFWTEDEQVDAIHAALHGLKAEGTTGSITSFDADAYGRADFQAALKQTVHWFDWTLKPVPGDDD